VQGRHLGYLDGWRGLAIVVLLVGHFLPVPGIDLGAVGVDLFFVLSGCLMCRLLFEQAMPIPTFYRRRVSRIFPAHYLFLFAVTLWYRVAGYRIDWAELAGAAGFVKNYVPVRFGDAAMPFGHVWSLCVEEHSYVILSLVALLARQRKANARFASSALGSLAAVFAAAGIAYWWRYSGVELQFDKWLHSEVSAYGIFVSAWLALRFRERGIPAVSTFAVPLLLIVGVVSHWWSIALPFQTIVGVGAFALAVNLLPAAGASVRGCFELRPLRVLGVWSFSIYLWQQPFYLLAAEGRMPTWIAIAVAIAAGIVSFHFVERPLRRYLNRVWAPERPLPSAAVGRPVV
jgi:peptidoglycan/LPS O-acetylase OafA/YrhL